MNVIMPFVAVLWCLISHASVLKICVACVNILNRYIPTCALIDRDSVIPRGQRQVRTAWAFPAHDGIVFVVEVLAVFILFNKRLPIDNPIRIGI